MPRPFKKIEDVLDELGAPKQLRHNLTVASREIVDLHRAKNPQQMRKYLVGDLLPLPLASEFLRKNGQMLYSEQGEWTLQHVSESEDEELREAFAHIIGRQILGREERAREQRALRGKVENELDEEQIEVGQILGRSTKRRRRNALPIDSRATTEMKEDSARLTDLHSDKASDLIGSPELLPPALIPKSSLLPQRSVFSISTDSSGDVRPSIEPSIGNISQAPSHVSSSTRFQRSDLLRQISSPATKIRTQLPSTPQPRLPDIPPTPASFDYHRCLSVSEMPERTVEESFAVCCGDMSYRASGETCAKAIRMAILLLNSLKADLALAAEQETKMDCQNRVSHILRDIEDRMRD